MKKWVLQNEWSVEIFVEKGNTRNFKVQVRNADEKDQELARWLTRIIELWLKRQRRF